jgi:hypothetical protein
MAFAQLTYRDGLRDIEACLRSLGGKLYHMGFHGRVARSTLADANDSHDWRIYADFAQVLIRLARPLYAADPIGVDLDQSLYALDSTTIDLCLSLFPWAKFRKHKAAVKMHTLLDLHGNIPTFISITSGKVHDVNILDEILPEAGAFYVMDRGYVDFERLFVFTLSAAFFVVRAASANQGVLRHQRKRREDPNLDRRVSLCAGRHRPKAFGPGDQPLPNSTDFERDAFRENAHFTGTSATGFPKRFTRFRQSTDSV